MTVSTTQAAVARFLAAVHARDPDAAACFAPQPERAWLERIDRFLIDGREYAIECNAVVEVDPETGLILQFRDYVDLGVWRERLAGVLDR